MEFDVYSKAKVFDDSLFASKKVKVNHWIKKESENGVCKYLSIILKRKNQAFLVSNKAITLNLTSKDGSKVGELLVTVSGTIERKRKSNRTANGTSAENGESSAMSANGVNPRRSGHKNRDTIMGNTSTANANRNSTSSASAAGPSTQAQETPTEEALPEG